MESTEKFRLWFKRRFDDSLIYLGMAGLIPAVLGEMLRKDADLRIRSLDAGGQLARPSGPLISLMGFPLAGCLAVMNYCFCPAMNFVSLYLLLVILATWKSGGKAGLIAMGAGMLALFAVDFHHAARPGTIGWDLGIYVVVSGLLIFLIGVVRDTMANLERCVKARDLAREQEISDRKQSEERLYKSVQQFRQLAENITDVFWMRDLEATRMAYVSPAYEKIWGRSCQRLYQSTEAWLEAIHPEDRARVESTMWKQPPAGENLQEYRIITPDGTLRWIRDRAFPIRDSSGKVIRVVGIAEDITERHRLEREILEISDREQARMGQDLHDGLCQKLVSIAFDNNALEKRLAARQQAEVAMARQMGDLLDDAITEARALSHGLFPVQLEADGLHLALQQLVAAVNARGRVQCRLDCQQAVRLSDNAVAIHLYRIAQEAVNNALKHSQGTSLSIQLKMVDGRIELNISDDGVGIPVVPRSAGGMGMHTMNYRARTIGGSLTIERAAGGGTTVACSAPVPSN
jgi:PAS domain S-box-containing protein